MFKTRGKQEIVQSALTDLVSNSSISNFSPGAKARAIVEATSNIVANVGNDIAIGLISSLLPNAQGGVLDLIADSFGIQRLPEIRAQVLSGDQNLKYYVATGTFGDINNGSSISVPAGTEIKVSSDRGRADVIMVQRTSIVLPASSSSFYFAADQMGAVRQGGIAANSLTSHNFTGYADSAFASLLVLNDMGIAGRPTETDQNLRFRIANRMISAAEANETSIRLNALLVPGVADIRIIPNRSGLGTFDVVVFGISPVVADSIIANVQEIVNRKSAVGSRGIAVKPKLVGISMKFRLVFRNGTTQSDKNGAANAVRSAIRQHVLDFDPGQSFSVNRLVGVIVDAHQSILSVGEPNEPLDEILIWRQSSSRDTRFSRVLDGDFIVGRDEELIVEPFITAPIQVLEA